MNNLMVTRRLAGHQAMKCRLDAAEDDVLVLFENMFLGVNPMLSTHCDPGPVAGALLGLGVQPLILSSVDLGPFGAGYLVRR
jgi:hypothetical protein